MVHFLSRLISWKFMKVDFFPPLNSQSMLNLKTLALPKETKTLRYTFSAKSSVQRLLIDLFNVMISALLSTSALHRFFSDICKRTPICALFSIAKRVSYLRQLQPTLGRYPGVCPRWSLNTRLTQKRWATSYLSSQMNKKPLKLCGLR